MAAEYKNPKNATEWEGAMGDESFQLTQTMRSLPQLNSGSKLHKAQFLLLRVTWDPPAGPGVFKEYERNAVSAGLSGRVKDLVANESIWKHFCEKIPKENEGRSPKRGLTC